VLASASCYTTHTVLHHIHCIVVGCRQGDREVGVHGVDMVGSAHGCSNRLMDAAIGTGVIWYRPTQEACNTRGGVCTIGPEPC